jgi:hypothetical protein
MKEFEAAGWDAGKDDAAPFCAEIGMTAAVARETVRMLAAQAGYWPDALAEWSSADVPGAPLDMPPLFYAALLPRGDADDMPLGLGDSPAAALTDLIWALGGPMLHAALLADDPEPAEPEPAEPEPGNRKEQSKLTKTR